MDVLEEVGRETTSVFTYVGGITELGADAFGYIGRLRVRVRETFDQAFYLGVNSWSIVMLTSLFVGLVLSLESAQQAVSYGVSNLVGGAVAYGTARELGPLLTAIVVAGRVGSAIAAELGSMVVTEQVEALQSLGLSPTRMLVVPRRVALLVMLPLLIVLGDVIAIGGGAWMAQTYAHISYASFIESAREAVGMSDFLKGIAKGFFFATIIALVGSYQGLGTRGGAAGVGRAVTNAVVASIILIFIFNFALSYVFFGGGQ